MRISFLLLFSLLLNSCSATGQPSGPDPQSWPFDSDAVFDEPTLFAPGVISTADYELNNLFTTDLQTFYYTKSTPGFSLMTLVRSDFVDGEWTAPEVLPFSGQYVDVDPYLTPDGNRMLFISQRPNPGDPDDDYDVWSVEKSGGNWGEPRRMDPPVNSDSPEYYPALAAGGALYLSMAREDGEGSFDLYRLPPGDDGGFLDPVNLGTAINGESAEIDMYVDPQERYIIFVSYRSSGYGSGDLYVSFNENGTWTRAQNLGEKVNTPAREYTPAVTPDGRFLFFTSERGFADKPLQEPLSSVELMEQLRGPGNGLGDVYFIELSTLEPFSE